MKLHALSLKKSKRWSKQWAMLWAAPPVDHWMAGIWIALASFGVVSVYSAITFLAERVHGTPEHLLMRHLVRTLIGLGMAFLFSRVDYRWLIRWSRKGLIAALGLMAVVHLVGVTVGGATRWIQILGISFQPSDIVRLMLLLYLTQLLVQKQTYIQHFSRAFVPLFFWILLSAALIGLEDLSTAALLVVIASIMCFVGRVRVLHLGGLVLVGGFLAYLLLLASPERAARIESFVGVKLFPHTPTEEVFDIRGEGYQQRQALIAFATGGFTGVGPGKSRQRDFLPASYNDFIFAIIAEEYGFVGAIVLLGAFVFILVRGFLPLCIC